jgi:hypothetical protein
MTYQDQTPPFAMSARELADLNKSAMDAMTGMQKGFLDALQELNQQWVSGLNSEAALASELLAKLTSAKSIPDATAACQECATRHMELVTEASRQFLDTAQKAWPQALGTKGLST